MPGGSPQTLRPFMWRARQLYADTEIVSRTHEGIVSYDYAAYGDRVAQLANALSDAGYGEGGERLATFCWNHHRHFETYFAVPSVGAQLHTINPLLPDKHVQYIVENAADRTVFVDPSLLPKLEGAVADDPDPFETVERYVVMGESVPETDLDAVAYESFIADQPTTFDWPELAEDRPAGLCYTSGTTGKPKGVEYTQQMLWSHTMGIQSPQGIPLADDDVVMPVVPMFHVNAWGLPFSATAGGAKHVYPGPKPSPEDLAGLIEDEGVTVTAGVPTVWLGLMEYVEDHEVDLSTLDRLVVGGSAAPDAMIRFFDDHGVELVHAWGMTETAPVGTVSHVKHGLSEADYETRLAKRGKQGLVMPGLEFRVVDDDGDEVAHDGEAFGELHVRGPWVTTEYFARPEATAAEFADGYLKTGDVVTVDADGYIDIVDRAKDVIKSGGEWISSQELENELLGHKSVAEAAVIGVPHERWQERPLALVVPNGEDTESLAGTLREYIAESYPDWWVPDDVLTIGEIPKTATGKFDKKALREEYSDESLVEGRVPDDAAPE